jgi:hypothetical protein
MVGAARFEPDPSLQVWAGGERGWRGNPNSFRVNLKWQKLEPRYRGLVLLSAGLKAV